MSQNYRHKYQSFKKTQEAINRFNYHKSEIIPQLFLQLPFIGVQSRTGRKQVTYFYAAQTFQEEVLVDHDSILYAINALHLERKENSNQILKLGSQSLKKITQIKTHLFSWSSLVADEILEFCIEGKQKNEKFQLYIIHHCQADNEGKLKWLHFVEKYVFLPHQVQYELIGSCARDSSYWNFSSNIDNFQGFLESHFTFNKLQGYLLHYEGKIKEKIKISEDPAFSDDVRILRKIPSQFLKGYYSLEKQYGKEMEHNISRYYIAQQFNYQETKKSLNTYIEWKKQLEKYKWEDFQEFHDRNIFTYLGEDNHGYPIVINNAKNVMVDEMDLEKYCIYYMYYVEIYLQTKCRGNISQVSFICDVEDVGMKNFKLAITKRNIQDGNKYCAERQLKLYAINANVFAEYCWKFIKPLLPKRTVEKIFIVGKDKEEIFNYLLEDMPIQTIPTKLGGKNQFI